VLSAATPVLLSVAAAWRHCRLILTHIDHLMQFKVKPRD